MLLHQFSKNLHIFLVPVPSYPPEYTRLFAVVNCKDFFENQQRSCIYIRDTGIKFVWNWTSYELLYVLGNVIRSQIVTAIILWFR